MQLLKQSTAATTLVGPVLDSTGAAYTGAAIGDLNITKNGTTAAMASPATLTYSHNGYYLLAFGTGDPDTLGRLDISCNKATYAMPQKTFEVLTAATFDAVVTNAAGTAGGMLYNGSNTGAVIPTVTNLTNAPTAGDLTPAMKTSVTTAATAATPAVASVTGNVGGSVASVVADVGITQAGADKVWGTTTRVLTAGTNIVLAKGTGVTGFNDIAATAIVSNGAITTSAGKVSGVALVDVLTTYTGNTVQTVDAAAIKAKTDNLPSDPTSATTVAGQFATLSSHGDSTWSTATGFATATTAAAIKAKTDNLPSDPASASTIATEFSTLTTHGDSAWATATGFATHSDAVSLASGISTIITDVVALGSPMQAGAHVQLATTQDQYVPAVAGNKMDLVDAPNATAIVAIQLGLATASALATVSSLVTAIQAIFSGMTSLPKWLRTILKSSAADATALAEINSSGTTYVAATQSIQYIASVAGTGGGGGGSATLGNQLIMIGLLENGNINPVFIGPVLDSGKVVVVERTDWLTADSRQLSFILAGTAPDLTDASIELYVEDPDSGNLILGPVSGAVVVPSGDAQEVTIDIPNSDLDVVPGTYNYIVKGTLTDGSIIPLARGTKMFVIQDDYSGP